MKLCLVRLSGAGKTLQTVSDYDRLGCGSCEGPVWRCMLSVGRSAGRLSPTDQAAGSAADERGCVADTCRAAPCCHVSPCRVVVVAADVPSKVVREEGGDDLLCGVAMDGPACVSDASHEDLRSK